MQTAAIRVEEKCRKVILTEVSEFLSVVHSKSEPFTEVGEFCW